MGSTPQKSFSKSPRPLKVGFLFLAMSIIHISKKENPFVQIDKRALEDNRLSWRAKGILAYLLSKPSGWKVNVKDIWNNGAEGRNAVQDCLIELQNIGYAELRTVTGEHGKLMGSQWLITEEPKGGFSESTDKPKMGKPTNRKSVSRVYSNNEEYSNNELSERENEHTPARAESDNLKAEKIKRGVVAALTEAVATTHTVTIHDPELLGVTIKEAMPAVATALTYDQYPKPKNSQELKESMRNYFVANPREWQDGVLEQSHATKWTAEKIGDCMTAFCAHQEAEGNLKRTYGQYKGMLVKWFLSQPSFDRSKPGAGASAQQQRSTPSALPLSLQTMIGK